ncbi:MAG: FAD-dependent oxidoreductase [Myxococcota bacterium]
MASIAVVGGGLAGLVCAGRLQRAGHAVEILESASAVGGRLCPIDTEHGPLARAVGEVGEGDANLRSLVASLGLEESSPAKIERVHALVLGGRLHRPPPLRLLEFLFPGLSPRMDRPIDAVFRRPPRWRDQKIVIHSLWDSLRRPSLSMPDSIRVLDDLSWSRASIRAFGTRWCTTRLAPALLARTGVDLAAESASVVVPMLCRLLKGSGRSVPLAGGLAGLVHALAKPLTTQLGCQVQQVEATGESVRIRFEKNGQETVRFFDGVVLALPPGEIRRICSTLTAIERDHFESISARRSIVMHRQISDEAWLLRGISGVTFVPGELPDMRDLRILGRRFEPYSSKPFWIRLSLEHESVDQHWQDSDQTLIHKFDSTFRRSPLGPLPEGPSQIERLDEIISVQGRGALARRERFESRASRTPRLSFATEALTTPDLEGRVTAGMRAASESNGMMDRLSRSSRPRA